MNRRSQSTPDPLNPLVLVRHAEAEHHIREITGGWTDTDLTERGHYQSWLLAARLAQELRGVPLLLGCSNLRRAVQTARPIGDALGIESQIYPDLTDLNNGIAAGKTHAEARLHAIPPSEPILDWRPYPQAESWRQFFQRVAGFIDSFTARQERAAILVSHAATIHVIVAWWLGLSLEYNTSFSIAPASLTVLTTNRWGERTLERLNDTAHLYANAMRDPIKLD